MPNAVALLLAQLLACRNQDPHDRHSGPPKPEPCEPATTTTDTAGPEPTIDSCPTITATGDLRWDEGWIVVQPGEPCPDVPDVLHTTEQPVSVWRGEICAFLRVEPDRVLVDNPNSDYCFSGTFHDAECLDPDLIDLVIEGPGDVCFYLALFERVGVC